MFNNCDITGNSDSQGIVEDKRFFQRAEILDYILRGLYRVLKNLFSSGLVIEKNVSEVTNLTVQGDSRFASELDKLCCFYGNRACRQVRRLAVEVR